MAGLSLQLPAAMLLCAQRLPRLWVLWMAAQPGAVYSPWLCYFRSSCGVPGTVFCV